MPFRHALAGAALGGLAGGVLGHRSVKGDSAKDKARRHGHTVAGALRGAAVGGIFGADVGIFKNIGKQRKWEQHSRRGHSRDYGGYSRTYRRPTDHRPHMGTIGLSGQERTKGEAVKKYRAAAMKHHPDRGGNAEKMKEVNSAWDHVKGSDWFNKLAAVTFVSGFATATA